MFTCNPPPDPVIVENVLEEVETCCLVASPSIVKVYVTDPLAAATEKVIGALLQY